MEVELQGSPKTAPADAAYEIVSIEENIANKKTDEPEEKPEKGRLFSAWMQRLGFRDESNMNEVTNIPDMSYFEVLCTFLW